jgi:dolichol kinase
MIGIDVFRQRSANLNKIFLSVFGPFLREGERHSLAASTAMMAGVTLIIIFFPKPVVLLALLFLAVGDPIASYFGIRFGKDKLIGNKSLQGSVAAFVACFILAFLFFSYTDLMSERRFIACLLAGLIGAVSELVPIGKLDDNFVFPVLAAFLLNGLYYIFGGLQ